ncbi:ABC-type multidrug transport system ATPase subunit [Microbacterium terrae]|uniref:Sulfate/thiosulfate import ATP-binding protein CysA n=1 Tax=Microbacterium terrae TaxID=69369 RepID=A0A0M2HHV1_9MICO|nr:Sulfate/thiosulfate import ATP-binding protein CysA [Microbacterium terrae]MBP1078690.1 ABC-type multidrug transport system ATPase subunit [Microbacterium terrae]GLJ98091.1 hypothetical protein GCM10017594_12880 [Microbacterium terrae]
MGDAVIQIEQLTKSYGRFQALKGLDLTVEKGQVHGFLGPNGGREVDHDSGAARASP